MHVFADLADAITRRSLHEFGSERWSERRAGAA
jgi:hypothetical protein